jgi:hypothetical protein
MRKRSFSALLWLALATVLALALDPFAPVSHETPGSAFSFFTSDVSLGPTRAPAPEKAPQVGAPTFGDGSAIAATALSMVRRDPFAAAARSVRPAAAGTVVLLSFVADRTRTRGPPLR